MSIRFVDELEDGLGWTESERMRRTSHALAVDGRVWLIDPIEGDGLEERLRALGEPAGVIQLLDRHNRDGATLSARLGLPLHVVPASLPETPFQFLAVLRGRWWKEVALWWPERRILVCADALGTIPFFRAGDEPAGLHPFLRPWPPRSLRGLEVDHLLVGHGDGIHHHPTVVESALRTARRRLPRLLLGLPRAIRAREHREHKPDAGRRECELIGCRVGLDRNGCGDLATPISRSTMEPAEPLSALSVRTE